MALKSFVFRIFFALVFMFGSVGMLPSSARQASEQAAEQLLQYAADGHILGFGADKVVLAGLDHALTVNFVSGRGSGPVAAEAGTGSEGSAPALGKVMYPQVWPGVDVVYSTSEGNITESTYVLAAGADVADVRLKYNVPVQVLNDGGLSFSFENGEMTESAPVAWQEVNGKRMAVDVKFEKLGAQEVGFVLGAHDPAFGVTIDPTYAWHTFYGSTTGSDIAYGIALDADENIYVTGQSKGTWNGPNDVLPLNAFSGGSNTFVLKLNNLGEYQWHTFYGNSTADLGTAIAVLGTGLYVTGEAHSVWNGPSGQTPLHAYSGGVDIFVLKLDANGAYQWHTFYGSSDDDLSDDIAVALENIFAGTVRIYVTGQSAANWLGDGSAAPLHPFVGFAKIFALRLNGDGSYMWHTFYGSSGYDYGYGIQPYGSALYILALSFNPWNGDGNTAPLHDFTSGNSDFVVIKLNTSGAYQWHTFYGSSLSDTPNAIDVDASGVYVIGDSLGSWAGPGGTAPKSPHHGMKDVAVLKLDANGAYQWHTFLGGAADDKAESIDLLTGTINIAGISLASWVGPDGQLPANAYAGGEDITNIRLDSSGNYLFHTFYGSASSSDGGTAIAVDPLGNLYTAGYSYASWNGPGNISPKNAIAGMYDIAVIKTSPTPVFADVPPAYWAAVSIETLYASGITGGCSSNPLTYCPATPVTRAQMAIFLVRARHGINFVPPAATGVFSDVPVGSFGANYIEQLAADGITSGCGGGKFCPNTAVTRAQMAIFLVKSKHGVAFVPPTATGMFPDVPAGSFGADYIEQLAADGVTSGCGGGNFCPGAVVKRDSMAVFLVKNFTLP